ncbi:hypothetical protein SVAN01_04293 [Stagonosporopsis vannaccii]|nr:hypothetical protein SVAN01_04293 [Stagonosporopsis vannaccii]
MAHQPSVSPAGSVFQSYNALNAVQDSSLSDDRKGFTITTSTTNSPTTSRRFAQSWSILQVLFTGAIPVVTLAAWLACVRDNPHLFDTFAGERIGGRFSQAEAKAIDVVTGAVLAPLFMAALNYVWFGSARVSAVNEQQPKAIPLQTLVAASGASEGHYNLFFLRDLVRGKTWRLFLLGVLTLFSAVSKSALSNIIAYEAFSENDLAADPVRLRLQRDFAMEADSGMIDYSGMNLYDFNKMQNAEVAKEMVALLTELTYENAAPRLSNYTYIAINATAQSLDSLPQSVVKLRNVPAYRLSVSCTPDLPTSMTVLSVTGLNTQITTNFNETASSNNTLFQASYPGVPADMQQERDNMSFVGFAFGNYKEAYLGHLNRFNLTNATAKYGSTEIPHRAFNMSQSGFTGTQGVMSVSGIRCLLHREHGLVNTTRHPSNISSAGIWNITTSNFPAVPDDATKELIPSLLSKFQWSSLNFHAPSSTIPGLGPALSSFGRVWREGDPVIEDRFPDFTHNFLYASGETQRILHEVAATNTSASHHPAEFFVDVTAFATQQHYRITYVPSILLVGLLCLLGASMVTGGMAAYARTSASSRADRQVNVVRLLVDSVLGLESDKEDLIRAAQSSNRELNAWAATYKVRYTSVNNGDGTVQIVLEKINE